MIQVITFTVFVNDLKLDIVIYNGENDVVAY